MELVKTLVTDFEQLVNATPTDDPDITEFIIKRNLPVFVDSDFRLYYKNVGPTEDPSFRRSLQEISGKLFQRTGVRVVSLPVEQAVFESFQARTSANTSEPIGEIEANQKVEDILNAMVERNASDLHIKVQEYSDVTTIRMRVNGELVHYGTLSFAIGDALLRSLWINYSDVDRTERSINNGSFYFRPRKNPNKEFMVRMTESPEARGMMFVARIRDPQEIRKLEEIGYNAQQLTVIQNLLGHRKGLASINGPTNSGKSSTQSSMLSLMPASMHIVEIGDPVETYQDHVAHFELRESYPGGKMAHLDHLLGATVRQDPDILALTEMRDSLTAKAALQLASQGKFVITTMHTTDFVSCFERFQRMGLSKEDLMAPGFLRGLVCQKLLPKLCQCALDSSPVENETQKYAYIFGGGRIRYRNRNGCPECHHTGIIDRVLVAEAVEITHEMLPIIRKILFDSNPQEFYDYARKHHMLNIHQHACARIRAGEVDPSMAETDIGRFGKENLLWMYPTGERQ